MCHPWSIWATRGTPPRPLLDAGLLLLEQRCSGGSALSNPTDAAPPAPIMARNTSRLAALASVPSAPLAGLMFHEYPSLPVSWKKLSSCCCLGLILPVYYGTKKFCLILTSSTRASLFNSFSVATCSCSLLTSMLSNFAGSLLIAEELEDKWQPLPEKDSQKLNPIVLVWIGRD